MNTTTLTRGSQRRRGPRRRRPLAGPASTASAAAYTCYGATATIVGTSGSDEIEGTSGRDVIVGLAGNDEIDGNGGNDIICGNAGRDEIDGGCRPSWPCPRCSRSCSPTPNPGCWAPT